MHRILQRQLERTFGKIENVPKEWQELLKAVSDTYQHFDEDRELLDRSLSISSKEFSENSKKLREAKEKVEEIVKERTRELEQEKSRLLSSIESLSLGFGIFNIDGSIFKLNDIFKKIFHLTTASTIAEIEKQTGEDIKLQEMLKDSVSNKRAVTFNNIAFEKKFLRIFISPILLRGSDEIIGAVMLVDDTTKEQEIEKAKTEFIILASHQLRTPLTVIRWHANLLDVKIKAMPELAKEQKYIRAIEDGCLRMSELIEDLLNVTRIEAGKLTMTLDLLDFKNVSETTISELKHYIDEKDLRLEQNYQENLPQTYSDKNLLRMIIHNLLTNAIKYTPEQGLIKINLKLSEDKKSLEFIISDNGYGIPFEEQSKIFTKLFRADNIKLTKSSGSGLGLYITKSLVEYLGGKIWFKSDASQTVDGASGTTFYVSLPVKSITKN